MTFPRLLRLALLPLFFFFGFGTLHAQGAAPAHTVWVCPPCGSDCDDLEFDHPGLCPHCGMTLVPKDSLVHQPVVEILLFNGVQIIDYSGPWEVFGQAHYHVVTVAQTKEPIHTVFGETVTPDYDFAGAPKADILVIPGGNVNAALWSNTALIGWIRAASNQTRTTLSVCTGAFLLAKTGLLDGLTATTFHGALNDLKQIAPKTRVVFDQRFVDNGRIVVTAGLSSGIDGALDVVSKMDGLGTAETVALNMEYNWDRHGSYARAALADRNLAFSMEGINATKYLSREGDRTQWTESVSLADKAPASEVEGKVDALLASQAHWVRQPDGTWRFTDSEGAAWTGTAELTPATGDSGEHVLTLSIRQSIR